MQQFDYIKYLKNNPLLKEEKNKINEFYWVPFEWAADKIGDVVNKIHKKNLDPDKKIAIDVDYTFNDRLKNTEDPRYAQFLSDLTKKIIEKNSILKQSKAIQKLPIRSIELVIYIPNKSDKLINLRIYDANKKQLKLLSREEYNEVFDIITDQILKDFSKGIDKEDDSTIVKTYNIDKLYPLEKKNGEIGAKIQNPSPEVKQLV
jgi:hypothetical protein